MKPNVMLLILGLASGAMVAPQTAAARPPAGKVEKKKEAGPTEIDKKIKLSPDGIRFGMTVEEIAKLYEKVFDEEFVPLYKAVEPGPRMNELDAELADKKQLILRNRLDFGGLPSGLDNSPLAGEYTYNNGESVSQVQLRSGVHRYFFFFGNHLWKVYDVHKLGKKSKLGSDYEGVVAALTKQFGKAPRARSASPAERRNLDQADWQDKDIVVRVLDHGGGKAGVAYLDRKIEQNLEKYRSNKGDAKEELDRDVSDVTKSSAPEDKGDAKAKKKK